MSIQQRSKSAPQLATSSTFQNAGDNTTLYKRQQSFVHSPVALPSTSRRRQDEPFALSGFFPSYLSPLKESYGDERWNWLRGDEEEDAESAYTASEEDPTVPPTPVEYDESENPDRVIQREDKLGILRLRKYQTTPFSPNTSRRIAWLIVAPIVRFLEEGQQTQELPESHPEQGPTIEIPSKLLYLEQNVDSFDDMCDTYRARRRARDRVNTRDITKGLSTGPLFSPAQEDTEKTEEDWDDVLYRGWQRVTDLLF